MEYYLAITKKNPAICDMEGREDIMLSGIDGEKQSLLCGI